MTPYPHLLAPLDLGHVVLSNRVIKGSMHLGLEEAEGGFERMAAFYGERASHDVALIVTGGIAPNAPGRHIGHGAAMTCAEDIANHRVITDAVHEAGGRIAMQVLHFGRYADHDGLVAPSAIQAPINKRVPRALTATEVKQTIDDFARAAELARQAGYDGVEVMGSEGYLINTFLAARTNQRDDEWGGDPERRRRFATEIVRRTRQRVGDDFIVMFRMSMLDLIPGGSSLDDNLVLAKEIEAAGASIINSGIGWHESRVPTIATSVPRAAFTDVTAKVKQAIGIPVVASNRINTPDVAERLLTEGVCDLVSLARPFLADPEFVTKAAHGRADRINTCIGCNQACIDHTLSGQITSCLVNPLAANETVIELSAVRTRKHIAVVGAGPAGMACALAAARRGHRVELLDGAATLGGQFDLARRIPGKEEFAHTLRYFATELAENEVDVKLGRHVSAKELAVAAYDAIVIATGVRPRVPEVDGIDHASVVGYLDVLNGADVGDRVAIMGAGGIGFDIAEFITQDHPSHSLDIDAFSAHWGFDPHGEGDGGLVEPRRTRSRRQVHLLQRKPSKVGAGLGVTTGWIHRAELAARGVEMVPDVHYVRIDDLGLHVEISGSPSLLAVDTVVVCTGQESRRDLYDQLTAMGVSSHLIGGAAVAAELDAKRAIRQGVEVAASL
jgi:2,4-dienoyl-CoA reductase (NADPH2)